MDHLLKEVSWRVQSLRQKFSVPHEKQGHGTQVVAAGRVGSLQKFLCYPWWPVVFRSACEGLMTHLPKRAASAPLSWAFVWAVFVMVPFSLTFIQRSWGRAGSPGSHPLWVPALFCGLETAQLRSEFQLLMWMAKVSQGLLNHCFSHSLHWINENRTSRWH